MASTDLWLRNGGQSAGQAPEGGPLERLALRVLENELPLAEAQRLAAAEELTSRLTVGYIRALSESTTHTAHEAPGPWPLLVQDLAVIATEAAGSASEMEADAVLGYIEVARACLIARPDGRVLARAVTRGERLEQQAREAHDLTTLAHVLHCLGTLHLDPYTADRTNETFWEGQQRWLQRSAGATPMPEPRAAFERAERFLGQAAELRTGGRRGRSLKAQGEAMLWRRVVGDKVGDDRIRAVLREALANLRWDEDPQMRLSVLNDLKLLGDEIDLDEVDRIHQRSLDEWRRRLGPARTSDLVMQSYLLLRENRPREALRLLRDARPLARERGEERRIAHCRAEVTVLSTYLAGGDPPAFARGGLAAAVDALERRARDERWDAERLFGGLLGLVIATRANDEEDQGLELLADIRGAVAPLLQAQHEEALAWLAAGHLHSVAVNGYGRGDWPAAIDGYSRALQAFLSLDMGETALDCLALIVDLIHRGEGGLPFAVSLARGIAPSALHAERVIGPRAAARFREAAERIQADSSGTLTLDVLLFSSQLAKGLRFATALYGGSRYRWSEDETGTRLLSAARSAEADVADRGSWAPLDEGVLLAEYVPGADAPADDAWGDPAERLAWHRSRYDEHLWEELLDESAVDEALWLSGPDVMSALDERTALLSYFVGRGRPGDGSTVALLMITRKRVQRVVLSAALDVRGTREAVQANPRSRDVTREGAQRLADDYDALLGDGSILDGLRADGVDHLCIVPHGSLHYYPFHLLGASGAALADDWIVTYLPNLHLFVSRRGLPSVRRHRDRAVSAVGLGFAPGNPHGLPELVGAVPEAEAVARAFGVQAITDVQATETSVRQALESSRLIHISTHGRHDAEAPAFQCLYLSPDAESDGRLEAHELLGLDLRGLNLVTLGACETALGRFDASDNLRGLPAALLLSGVSSLIGTLWEVEDGTARTFFVELYERLRLQQPCLDAFRGAQAATRREHRAYRDWGAFYLAGDWQW